MKYDLSNQLEAGNALNYLLELTKAKKMVEIKRISPNRSLNQNNYLHLILGAFGSHFGYTLEEAKTIYKQINADIYRYTKKGRTFWRSSADLSKEEMAKSIDKFMQKSAEAGYPLPPPTNQEWLRQIENELERNKYYL